MLEYSNIVSDQFEGCGCSAEVLISTGVMSGCGLTTHGSELNFGIQQSRLE